MRRVRSWSAGRGLARMLVPALAVASALLVPATAPAAQAPDRGAAGSAAGSAAAEPEVLDLAAERGIGVAQARLAIAAQRAAAGGVDSLRSSLGAARFGGLWIGADDRVKIGVVGGPADHTAARRAAEALGLGGSADTVAVEHGLAAIEAGHAWLAARLEQANRGAGQPLHAAQWVAANAVELRLPEPTGHAGLTAAQHDLVAEARSRLGSMLRTGAAGEVAASACNLTRCDPPLRGGVLILGDQPCTLGFVVRGRGAGNLYAMTAGHCAGDTWSMRQSDGSTRRIGTVSARRFSAGGDGAIVHVANTDFWRPRPWVYVDASPDTTLDKRYDIRDDGRSVEGMRICATGAFGGTDCGRVTRLNMSVTYGGRTVDNLGEADFCHEAGDSGGPVYAGHVAYGLIVARGRPSTGCLSYYQGIRAAEDFLNVDVVVS